MIRVLALVVLAALPATAETRITTARYACDRDVQVPATYLAAEDQSAVVIHVDGAQITLLQEPSGSGARYGWPTDGTNYVWWTKGDDATLYWKTPEGEAELPTCTATS